MNRVTTNHDRLEAYPTGPHLMFLSEPPESPYDVHFNLLGVPVRVAWTFWLVALIFGYNAAVMIDEMFMSTSPGAPPWLAIWCGVMFASILLHELGHAIAFRMCGMHASIVLYHFGGLAIPSGHFTPGRRGGRLTEWQGIFISAAGPGIQLVLAVLVIGAVRLSGYGLFGGSEEMVYGSGLVNLMQPLFLRHIPGLSGGEPIVDAGMFTLVSFTIYVNIYWALLNLLPVWPLDGGQIAREVIALLGGTTQQSLQLSMLVAGGMALWFFTAEHVFAAILFASLAASSYQLLSATGGWRY